LPLQFFTGYGDLTHQRWEEFLQFADDKCPASEYEVASTTAASLFSAIKMHLDDIHLRSLAEIG
jgi:heme oxygenase